MTYRDNAIAEYEARRLRPAAVGDSGGKQILSLPSRGITHIVLKESTVFLIQDYSGKKGESVKHIAAELAKLQSPN